MSGAVRQAATTLRRALAGLEVGDFGARECATLAEELAATANACNAASMLLAARAASLGAHTSRGFADPAGWIAHHAGTTTRQAKQALETAKGLEVVPHTKDAVLAGEVSLSQAQEIAQSEKETPGGEAELLSEAKKGDLSSLRSAARERMFSETPPGDLHRRQHCSRFLRHWRDRLGMVRFEGALPPESGVPLMNRLEHRAQRRRRRAKGQGVPERFESYMADALVASVLAPSAPAGSPAPHPNQVRPEGSGFGRPPRSASAAADGDIGRLLPVLDPDPQPDLHSGLYQERQPDLHAGLDQEPRLGHQPDPNPDADPRFEPDQFEPDQDAEDPEDAESRPRTELVIVCDLFAWRRGHAHSDEVCHIVGGGPIPVDLARELGRDAFLKAVLHDGVNIHTVCHFGRHRPAALQTALDLGPPPEFTGGACVDCGRRYGLEYDHTDPVNNRGPTSFENLKPRCYLDHREKTERDRRAGLLGPTAPGRRGAKHRTQAATVRGRGSSGGRPSDAS